MAGILSKLFEHFSVRGNIGSYVSCKHDPMDLRPVADAILRQMEARLNSAAPNMPIVILMGEAHNVPAYQVLQEMVLGRVLQSSSQHGFTFGVGFEDSADAFEDYAQKVMPVPEGIKGGPLYDFDKHGRHALMASLADGGEWVGGSLVRAFCLQHHISARYTDAPYQFNNGRSLLTTATIRMDSPIVRRVHKRMLR